MADFCISTCGGKTMAEWDELEQAKAAETAKKEATAVSLQKMERAKQDVEATLKSTQEELKASRDHEALLEKAKAAAESNIRVRKAVSAVREKLLKTKEAQLANAKEGEEDLAKAIGSLEADLNVLIAQSEEGAEKHVAAIGDTYESVIAAELETKTNLEAALAAVVASQEAAKSRLEEEIKACEESLDKWSHKKVSHLAAARARAGPSRSNRLHLGRVEVVSPDFWTRACPPSGARRRVKTRPSKPCDDAVDVDFFAQATAQLETTYGETSKFKGDMTQADAAVKHDLGRDEPAAPAPAEAPPPAAPAADAADAAPADEAAPLLADAPPDPPAADAPPAEDAPAAPAADAPPAEAA